MTLVRRGHVPQRMCEGCRRRFARDNLVRFMVDDSGGARMVVIDSDGHSKGRGAYTCASTECFQRALGKKARPLVRRLRAESVHPDLEGEFASRLEERGR